MNKIIENVYDSDKHEDWPTNLVDFAKWINEKIELIPEEHQQSARIDIYGIDKYDCPAACVDISYSRLESKEEVRAREVKEQTRLERIENQELELLARLKEKYDAS